MSKMCKVSRACSILIISLGTIIITPLVLRECDEGKPEKRRNFERYRTAGGGGGRARDKYICYLYVE